MLEKLLIRLEASILEDLEKIAREEHTTKTQLIRDAINEFLVNRKSTFVNNELLQYAGIFKGTEMEVDGLEYQRKIRAEWDRDL